MFFTNVGEPTGIAEGQSGNRTNQLLKLIRVTGIDRPMTGIVWLRRNFVRIAAGRHQESSRQRTLTYSRPSAI